MASYLETKDIRVTFGNKNVLNNISANFPAGAMTAVIGSNGVGKTTYLKAVSKLIRSHGEICIVEDGKRSYDRKRIAYVPQLGSVQTKLTVFEMVLLGLVNNLKWHVTSEQTEKVYQIIRELGLEAIATQPFNTLSGGQKQLVSMAQSLISKPKVLLLDEPTSALDLRHQLIVMELAKSYTKDTDAITIFVVHDLLLASRYGKQLLVLHNGGILAFDQAEHVLTPQLIETVYGVTARVEKTPEGFMSVLPMEAL